MFLERRKIYHYNFYILLFVRLVSSIGDRVSPIALTFAVMKLDHPVMAIGLVFSIKTIATVMFVIIGGILSDRISRKKILIVADFVRFVSQGLTALFFLYHLQNIALLLCLQFVSGAAQGFFRPASVALLADIVDKDHLQKANAMINISETLPTVLGASIAAVLISVFGYAGAIAFDSISFAISCLSLSFLQIPNINEFVKNSFVRDLLQGWREFQSRTWLVLLVSLFSIFHLFIWAPLNTLGPIILEHNEAGLQSWTYYLTSLGVGSILAGIVAFKIKMTKVLTLITVLFIPTILPLVALLLPHSVWLLAISGFVAGLAMGVSDILWNTSLQSKLPERSLSKVSSFDYFASMVFLPLGYAMVAPATKLMNEQSYLVLCIFVMVFATVAIIPLILKIERIDSNESTNLC